MTNQRRGYATENAAVNALRKLGYQAFRSSRSLGAYDIIAISDAEILLIQCKRTKEWSRRAPPKYLEKLRLATAPANACVRKQLWCWVDRHGWHITDVTQEVADAGIGTEG